MAEHPAITQQCTCRTREWRLQTVGQDFCVYCMIAHTGGSRCPGCEVLACPKCLRDVTVLERRVLGGLGSSRMYRPSGG